MKIVVYTGSFNPITRGHRCVMECAMETVGADKGLFVITAESYLRKKMLVKKGSPIILSDDVRKSMIESVSSINSKFEFAGKELGGITPSTVKTLKSIKRKYGPSELYILMGADKLGSVPKWTDIDSIIEAGDRECDAYIEMVRTGKMHNTYEELLIPVKYMNAVKEAYETGKCVEIFRG